MHLGGKVFARAPRDERTGRKETEVIRAVANHKMGLRSPCGYSRLGKIEGSMPVNCGGSILTSGGKSSFLSG